MSAAARPAGLLLGALTLFSACAGSAPRPAADAPTVAPTMTIERFLRAANQNDLDTMARLFGTRDGSVAEVWTQKELDDRMLLFASLLRHSDYSIEDELIVPGRRDEATKYVVRMVIDQRQIDVPFTLVMTEDRHWLIEDIDIVRVTRQVGIDLREGHY